MLSGVYKKNWKNAIPKPDFVEDVHYQEGDTKDIIKVILSAVKYNDYQAAREMKNVSKELLGKSVYETLYNVWRFVKDNIKYEVDKPGFEKIKNPALLYYYGKGDCKSFSLMIAGILMNYSNLDIYFRFTSYDPNKDFGHVYIVVRTPGFADEIILDSTIKHFDYEEKYAKKKDYKIN